MNRLLLLACFSLLVAAASADVTKGGFGAQKPDATEPPSESAPETKRNSYPFHGTLASIDLDGKKLTLEGKKKPRIILFTAETRFFRNGAKTKISEVKAGERITGTVRKNDAGEEVAVTVRYGGSSAARK
jgi:hypothetical protein